MNGKRLLMCFLCGAAAVLASCTLPGGRVVQGIVKDAKTGKPLRDVRITVRAEESTETRCDSLGRFRFRDLKPGDSLSFSFPRYDPVVWVHPMIPDSVRILTIAIVMQRTMDTAYTPYGPVDASTFLNSPALTHKKLSVNEARMIARKNLPPGTLLPGTLVEVNGSEEWMFELKKGASSIIIYIDAFTGEVKSIESDDPRIDRDLKMPTQGQ